LVRKQQVDGDSNERVLGDPLDTGAASAHEAPSERGQRRVLILPHPCFLAGEPLELRHDSAFGTVALLVDAGAGACELVGKVDLSHVLTTHPEVAG
jgi:hypothetical protein